MARPDRNVIEVSNGKLTVNGNTLDFGSDIRECQDFGDFVVVDLSLGAEDANYNQNVVAVEPDGSTRWRIDKCPHESDGGHDSYAGLFQQDEELWVYNLNGMKYKVDRQDGSIIDHKFVK